MGLNFDGICGIALSRKSDWSIIFPSLILVLGLVFAILGGFTYYYFHKHIPKAEGFQKKKYN